MVFTQHPDAGSAHSEGHRRRAGNFLQRRFQNAALNKAVPCQFKEGGLLPPQQTFRVTTDVLRLFAVPVIEVSNPSSVRNEPPCVVSSSSIWVKIGSVSFVP